LVKAWVLVVSVDYDWLVKWSVDCTGIGEIAGAEFGGSDEEMEQFDVVETGRCTAIVRRRGTVRGRVGSGVGKVVILGVSVGDTPVMG